MSFWARSSRAFIFAIVVAAVAAGSFVLFKYGSAGFHALAHHAAEFSRPLLHQANAAPLPQAKQQAPIALAQATAPAEDEPAKQSGTAAEPPTPSPRGDAPEETAPASAPDAPMKSAKPLLADTIKVPAGMEDVAKYMFAAKKTPSRQPSEPIGYYPNGCLAGGVALPINGPTWQVMRLSRNRNWGTPELVRFIRNFADRAAKATGWNGILVGDMSQPRGGPALSGHVSHQTGLDVDVWFVPMPKATLTAEQREEMSANNLVASDWKHVNPQVYTPQHAAFIKAAAQASEVERVLVNAAIKKKLCETTTGDRSWLAKVRPWYGHHDHIHVRLACPAGATQCKAQPPTPESEGCADSDFTFWFTKALVPPKPPTKPGKQIKLADMPAACKAVLSAP